MVGKFRKSRFNTPIILIGGYLLLFLSIRTTILTFDRLPNSLNNISIFFIFFFPLVTTRVVTYTALGIKTAISLTSILTAYANATSPMEQDMLINGIISNIVFPLFSLIYLEVLFRGLERIRSMNSQLAAEKEQAEKSRNIKAEFLANMSHEIKTPISGVIGMSQMMLSQNPPSYVRENVLHILDSSKNLLAMVNNILYYSKIESNKYTRKEKFFLLRPFLESLFYTMKQTIPEDKSLTLCHDLSADLPLCIYSDALKLRQILINLISNAIKYTPRGTVTLHCTPTSEGLCFNVIDTGIGIKEEHLTTIFEVFEQVDTHYTKEHQGTGLGLAISQQLAQVLQGTITVTSTEGEGSCFSLTLPCRVEQKKTESPSKEKASEIPRALQDTPLLEKSIHVLLAEDNRVNQIYIKHFLEKNNISTEIAMDGAEAVSLFEKSSFDLVLMDIQMPRMSGLEAAKKIRHIEQQKGSSPTPIIGISASTTEIIEEVSTEAGINAVFPKPINIAQVMGEFRKLQHSS
ncbi:hybrid sensor histidine kinase/response regulator [Chitinivibrio alkaliphilus]|uniref:histidine kinase n=1 Tax=Chitinivibrio alkaliphilus ACht1 TaxID=1313304 RepID=U7DAG7_9BACT|nr:ATP-binding protein [Chitinivibrio alkaliphilus]ERP31385.1 hypothetical protein CALK_1734 [Chitinivibrio alkaliphilus ACht1]